VSGAGRSVAGAAGEALAAGLTGDAATVLATVRALSEPYIEELSRAYHAAGAGYAADAPLQAIHARHALANGPEAFAAVRDVFTAAEGAVDAGQRRAARMLLESLSEAVVSRATAPLEEAILHWEATAAVPLPDGSARPYQQISIDIANAAERAERVMLDDARARVVAAELAPRRRDLLAEERERVAALGVADGYVATQERLSGIDLRALAAQCEAFLRDTQALWDAVWPRALRDGLGIDPRAATRADAVALLRARDFDDAFDAEAMTREVQRQVTEMGLSPDAEGRVTYDLADRPGKRSRAFCSPVRVPDEVYLVLRPHGGQNDWQTLLHELGHALHFAYADRALPFEARWLGDNSVTEGYAMLFDHRLQDGRWLQRYTPLRGARLEAYLRQAAVEELQFLRRYCAKLLYELELYGGTVAWEALPDRYVERLSTATAVRYQAADAFVDVDPRFYAARYLRAWQLQAVLDEALRERFDEDWWRNPRCGPWVAAELFGWGQRELADEQAQRVAGRGLDFVTIVRGLEQVLG
jgi:hypothetical protein